MPFYTPVNVETFAYVYRDTRRMSDLIREATSPFGDVDGTRYYLSTDTRSGYAIRPDGELVFVFSSVRGRGDGLVEDAIMRGASRLDCFDGHLTRLYGRHGFEVDRREPNWTPGGPDVVYMSLAPVFV